jgi:thiol-disulfide isomerase/thioredoxin
VPGRLVRPCKEHRFRLPPNAQVLTFLAQEIVCWVVIYWSLLKYSISIRDNLNKSGLKMKSLTVLVHLLFLMFPYSAQSQDQSKPTIGFIYMASSGCGPCDIWRATELPKLQELEEFKQVQFFYLHKAIQSSVPPRVFLPNELKPLKSVLDEASGGQRGAPQTVVLVNGKVFDYRHGSYSAGELQAVVKAVLSGDPPPLQRCVRRQNGHCAELVEAGVR